ncbi:MAG: type II toxin-antitoxin system VapC family toxin [Treponemataceae bacterium]|nr:type II toxin-antitoxin system VapC family toxin [Treponemataceae bacterium]
MGYLIDTHIFIWFMMEPERLTKKVLNILTDENNKIFISPISFWEMAIKCQSKKLDLGRINPLHLPHIAEQYDFTLLTPEPYDYVSIGTVPQKENHHDPFDRMLIQQAIRNNLVLLSKDEKFQQYEENGLQLLWN